MIAIHRIKTTVCVSLFGLLCLVAISLPAQEEEPNEALIQMIADLVGDSDQDMRALGLQQVRGEAPGEAATKKFAELLGGSISVESEVGKGSTFTLRIPATYGEG